jgi:hypothetical protein
MRTLAVSTDAYYKELDEHTSHYVKRAKKKEANSIRLYFDEFDAEGFYHLVDWIVFQENPALKGVQKLAEVIRNNIPKRMILENVQALKKYVQENRALHLEGYVKFRLAEYNDYLNRLMYAVVRKLNK